MPPIRSLWSKGYIQKQQKQQNDHIYMTSGHCTTQWFVGQVRNKESNQTLFENLMKMKEQHTQIYETQ